MEIHLLRYQSLEDYSRLNHEHLQDENAFQYCEHKFVHNLYQNQ
jgi:hypothetical protein